MSSTDFLPPTRSPGRCSAASGGDPSARLANHERCTERWSLCGRSSGEPICWCQPGSAGQPRCGRGTPLGRRSGDVDRHARGPRPIWPNAVVLGQNLFEIAQSPDASFVLPQDRIIPFLGGGPLLRSSALLPLGGVIVGLGGCRSNSWWPPIFLFNFCRSALNQRLSSGYSRELSFGSRIPAQLLRCP